MNHAKQGDRKRPPSRPAPGEPCCKVLPLPAPAALPDLDLLPCHAARLAAANVAPCCTYPKSQALPSLRPQGKPPPWGGGLGSRRLPLLPPPPPALRVSMYADPRAYAQARVDPPVALLGAGGYIWKRLLKYI